MAVEQSISEFLEQVSIKHGQEFREQVDVRHTGGSDVVITMPGGDKNLTSLGNLQLMTQAMRVHRLAA